MHTKLKILARSVRWLTATTLMIYTAASLAQFPPYPEPWPGPPGSYRSTVRFLVFTVAGNWQHSTQACRIEGAFISLNGLIPAYGQPPYGEMMILKSHPNYKEMVAAAMLAYTTGKQVDIQVLKDPSAPNDGAHPPLFLSPACDQIPIVAALGVFN